MREVSISPSSHGSLHDTCNVVAQTQRRHANRQGLKPPSTLLKPTKAGCSSHIFALQPPSGGFRRIAGRFSVWRGIGDMTGKIS